LACRIGQARPGQAAGQVFNFQPGLQALWVRPGQAGKKWPVGSSVTNDAENDTYFLILLLATAVFTDILSGNAT
jgi:hypothetical protein